MYNEHDRPSTKRIVVTLVVVVAVIAVLLGGMAAAFAAFSAPKNLSIATPKLAAVTVVKPKVAETPAPAVISTAPALSPAQPAAVATPAPAPKPAPRAVTPAPVSVAGLAGKVVVIDAGHQAHGDSSLEPIGPGSSQKKAKVASGASGAYGPYHDESQVNLAVALKLEKVLKARGVKVVMVRTTQKVNIANSARAEIANRAHAALFIRIHADSSTSSSTHGISMQLPNSNQWTAPIVARSVKAGNIVLKATVAATGAANRGPVQRGDLSGFNWSKVPTILIEMGFMSNPAEDKALNSATYEQKLATGMANGIVQYLKSK